MLVELIRLGVGLLIAFFHRPIADYVLERERLLVITFRQRGIPVPPTLTTETTRNLYFVLGISLALIELARIWYLLHPGASLAAVLLH